MLCIILMASGCEDDFIDPFNNDEKYFTVYGFLDESKNFQVGATQDVRIVAVTRNPENINSPSAPQADLDGRVFLTDVLLEQTRELTHSLREIQPGEYGHIFSTRIFIQPGRTYRLEVIRKDGITTTAETTVPITSSIVLDTQTPASSNGTVTQDIVLGDVQSIWSSEIVYHVSGGGCFNATQYRIPYGRQGSLTDQGWAIPVNISEDLTSLQSQGVINPTLCAMGIRARIMDDEWILPEGDLKLEEISLPDELTNVVNGYGYFGSTALFLFDWSISAELDALIN